MCFLILSLFLVYRSIWSLFAFTGADELRKKEQSRSGPSGGSLLFQERISSHRQGRPHLVIEIMMAWTSVFAFYFPRTAALVCIPSHSNTASIGERNFFVGAADAFEGITGVDWEVGFYSLFRCSEGQGATKGHTQEAKRCVLNSRKMERWTELKLKWRFVSFSGVIKTCVASAQYHNA
jgi:hypothetical protein